MSTYREPEKAADPSGVGGPSSTEADQPVKQARGRSAGQHPLASSERGPTPSSESNPTQGLKDTRTTIIATSIKPQQLKRGEAAICTGRTTTYFSGSLSNIIEGDHRAYYVTYRHVGLPIAKIAGKTPVEIVGPVKKTGLNTFEVQIKATQDVNFGGVDKFGAPIDSGYQVYFEINAVYQSHRVWKPGDEDRAHE